MGATNEEFKVKGEEFPGRRIVQCVDVLFICFAFVLIVLFVADVKAQGVSGHDWTKFDYEWRLWLLFLVLGYWFAFKWRDRDP